MRRMAIPAACLPMWRAFAATQACDPTPRWCEAFFFGDSAALASELAALVMQGRKRATAASLWAHEAEGTQPPAPGALSIVTLFDGTPQCVIETLSVDIRPFDQVDAAFAAAEGEGDGSLEYWRRAHEAFFGCELAAIGRPFAPDMPVVCERFRVLYPATVADAPAPGRR
jgi:uncharacterized protein YhfF